MELHFILAAFVPLKELIESLTPEKRERWERLYMLSDRRSMITHPLIYPHPVTKLPVCMIMYCKVQIFCFNDIQDVNMSCQR